MSQPAQRTDFYTLFHKGLRKRLFDAIVAVGCTDLDDAAAAVALGRRLDDLFGLLAMHAEVEETFVHPFWAEVAPDLRAQLEAEHHEHGAVAAALRARAARITGAGATGDAGDFYRALVRFVAEYLHHLEAEEAALPLLWDKVDEPALAQAFGAFQRSRTLPQLALSWELMLPAMTRGERHGLAAAVAAAAPPPVLSCFRASARAALAPAELAALAAAVPAVGGST